MAKAIFIFGGCRSGKSSYAVQRVKNCAQVVYVATSLILDDEIKLRIQKHKKNRPHVWETIESPYQLTEAIQKIEPSIHYIIVDCLTMYLANHFGRSPSLKKLEEQEK